MRIPTGDLTGTPGEALGVFLESHFPDARINVGLEIEQNTIKTGAKSKEWLKTRRVVTEERVNWTVNTLMPYKVSHPDGIYLICLQKKLDLII